MKDYMMKFCLLRRGKTYTYSWLPVKFAVSGKYVKLKDNGKWVDGWEVFAGRERGTPASIIIPGERKYKDLPSVRNTTNLK